MNTVYESLNSLIPRKDCQKYRNDGEFIVVSNTANKILFLNQTAKEIFILCDGANSIRDIVEKLSTIYNVDINQLQKDVVRTIRDFQWNNLITLAKKHSD